MHIKQTIILIAAMLLLACSHQQNISPDLPLRPIETHPGINTSRSAASITVYREKAFAGSAAYNWLAVDGIDVAVLRTGDFTSFQIAEGKHDIGVRCWGGWTKDWNYDNQEIDAAPGDEFHFLIKPTMKKCAEIEPMIKQNADVLNAGAVFVGVGIMPGPRRK
jgi:hypothetical protein